MHTQIHLSTRPSANILHVWLTEHELEQMVLLKQI